MEYAQLLTYKGETRGGLGSYFVPFQHALYLSVSVSVSVYKNKCICISKQLSLSVSESVMCLAIASTELDLNLSQGRYSAQKKCKIYKNLWFRAYLSHDHCFLLLLLEQFCLLLIQVFPIEIQWTLRPLDLFCATTRALPILLQCTEFSISILSSLSSRKYFHIYPYIFSKGLKMPLSVVIYY